LLSGVERHFEIFLDKKPSREHQKIKTLRKYVEHHASGWKNHLKLADLLYETGAWVEAVEGYRHVLKKQPWLTAVSVRLGEILCLIAGEEAALEVHELALPLAKQRATRCHLSGLIASCHRDFPLAVASFEEATTLEPNNAAHWRALAKALQRSGSSDKPLRRP
jgi:cytochrome c-type biogenesis protein CcmH/NrfG